MRYKVTLKKDDTSVDKQKKSELVLRDLLAVLPVLKKHKMDGDIKKHVRTLRDGRKQKHYVLEVSRKFACEGEPDADGRRPGIVKELKVNAPIYRDRKEPDEVPGDATEKKKRPTKMEVMKGLKDSIVQQIRDIRKAQLPPIETYPFQEGVNCKKLAEVYLEPGVFLLVQDKKILRGVLDKPKVPHSPDKYVGIEIEIAAVEDRRSLAAKLHAAGIGRNVYVKGDGSIGRGTDLLKKFPNQHEITVLAKESEFEDVINKLCKVINEEIHAKIDKTCGLHVHLDMRNRKPEEAFHNLITMQHFLYGMVPANRKSSTYSRPVREKKWAIKDGPDAHYDGISTNSYQKYNTIEIRMHCGTTQANKINSWIKFLLAIVNGPQLTISPKSIHEVKDILKLDAKLVEYIEMRIAKFAPQHKKLDKAHSEAMEKLDDIRVPIADVNVEEDSEVA